MAAYDFEEQERIAAIRDWWAKWGKLIYAALTAFLLGVAGTQGWKYYQRTQVQEAEALFVSLQKVAQETAATKDWKKLSDAASALAAKYPSTFYATDAQLMAAKAAFDNKDLAQAKKHLEWAAENGSKTHQPIAKVRLAAILLDEKKYDDALKMLDGIKSEGFTSMVADLRGDVFAASGRGDEARAAYQLAVDKAEERSPLKAISQSKLDAFGGATEKPVVAKTDPKVDPKSGSKADSNEVKK